MDAVAENYLLFYIYVITGKSDFYLIKNIRRLLKIWHRLKSFISYNNKKLVQKPLWFTKALGRDKYKET